MRIIRHRDRASSTLLLDEATRTHFRALGRKSQTILVAKDQDVWRRASSPDFLARLLAGAIVLQRVGLRNYPTAVLEDDSSYLALVTCIATSMVASTLDPELLRSLKRAIEILAMCCPVEITLESLPPLQSLPERFQKHVFIRRQYEDFAKSLDAPRDVTLADALALLCILQHGKRPEDSGMAAQLLKITAGLRFAMRQVRQASKIR